MTCILADISAFEYWRTPPIARLLASAPEDDELLHRLVSPERLGRLRRGLEECSPIIRASSGNGRAHFGDGVGPVIDARWQLAASCDAPLSLLASSQRERHLSQLARPRLWSGPFDEGSCVQVAPGLFVVIPAMALLQLAARVSETRAALLASELCGSFSVYEPPEPLRELLQELIDESILPVVGHWSPTLDESGRLTSLWSRPPRATVESLASSIETLGRLRGRRRLERALQIVRPGAASPLEVRVGMLLGSDVDRGGEGLGGFSFNREVWLTLEARKIARRQACVCDLFWEADPAAGTRALDVECQSLLCHGGAGRTVSDSNRTTALQLMGIDVVPVTQAQIADDESLSALSRLIARQRGVTLAERDERQEALRRRFHDEVMTDWERLHES